MSETSYTGGQLEKALASGEIGDMLSSALRAWSKHRTNKDMLLSLFRAVVRGSTFQPR